jgi:serine protease Do
MNSSGPSALELFAVVVFTGLTLAIASAEDAPLEPASPATINIEDLATTVQKSLVVIEGSGRSGNVRGEGSGFAIAEDLIATARHVIGEGRRVSILLPDSSRVPVLQIHSQMAHLDMVILKTAPHGLPVLKLSEQATTVGHPIVALGHPHGLRNSVVSGIVSGYQDIDDIAMIQLAMAIEPGNSGGPVVDHKGAVVGMVTLKSTASDNIGFAIPIEHLHGLVESPNPIPMERWVTIGALDRQRWEPIGGADWKQRAGRIMVEGTGTGFGGRTLCVLNEATEFPVEIEVDVKLDRESGAAGLTIHSDGGQRHYGFYPSAGNIRFTRFNGPDVNHWTILHNDPHSAYRPNDWNTIKVRIEGQSFTCFLNDEAAFHIDDSVLPQGRLGLAAFRGTQATFRNLTIAPSIPSRRPSKEHQQQIADLLKQVAIGQPLPGELTSQLIPFGDGVGSILESHAKQLETQAALVRQLADDVHTAKILQRLTKVLNPTPEPDSESTSPNLLRAALLLAELDNEEIRAVDYGVRVDAMAEDIRTQLAVDSDEKQRLAALDHWLFEDNGFRGSQQQYYASSNSYLNEVIDDREGLPITLSVLYMELAKRLDLNVLGIGLPGHFIVKFTPTDPELKAEWIDVFNRGKRMTDDDLDRHVRERGLRMAAAFLEPQSTKQIIERMIRNLLGLAEHDRNDRRVLSYLELLVGISPDNPEFRAKRLELRARTGHPKAAMEDAEWFIEHQPKGIDIHQLQQLKSRLQSNIIRSQSP